MKNIITNAFSLNMVNHDGSLTITHIDPERVNSLMDNWDFVSCVGHEDTAALFTEALGRPVAFNRCTVELNPGDLLIVGQYKGPRLPEGCRSLPEGARIEWVLVGVGGENA